MVQLDKELKMIDRHVGPSTYEITPDNHIKVNTDEDEFEQEFGCVVECNHAEVNEGFSHIDQCIREACKNVPKGLYFDVRKSNAGEMAWYTCYNEKHRAQKADYSNALLFNSKQGVHVVLSEGGPDLYTVHAFQQSV